MIIKMYSCLHVPVGTNICQQIKNCSLIIKLWNVYYVAMLKFNPMNYDALIIK